MRRRTWLVCMLAAGCWLAGGKLAFGQPQIDNPYIRRPPISPYTNLLRGGNSALIYHGLIQPQIEFERFREQQNVFNRTFQTGLRQVGQQGNGATGHPAVFMNYSHFYSMGGRRR